jgi:hypothetical protein
MCLLANHAFRHNILDRRYCVVKSRWAFEPRRWEDCVQCRRYKRWHRTIQISTANSTQRVDREPRGHAWSLSSWWLSIFPLMVFDNTYYQRSFRMAGILLLLVSLLFDMHDSKISWWHHAQHLLRTRMDGPLDTCSRICECFWLAQQTHETVQSDFR